ncbi:alpha-L-fucosidase [Terriglobus sp. RCC_193]|uniref:alpha-L-fucosidase n=1 Tax=Terriglobus sp. RCC_193 TaxID=3239218 RepID=UPI0035238FCB
MKFLSLVLAAAVSSSAVAQHPVQDRPQPRSSPRPSAQTVQQWQEQKFGMFIHFGLYSQLGGVWKGKQIDNGYSEQIMANAPIPMDEYAATAKTFNPTKWDPDAIVKLAKDAGMKFIVITSKHHDGFNMFHTAQTKYNVVDATPYHRDIVKELAEACRRGGIGFGVYYSSIDWHEPGMDTYIPTNSNPLSDAHAKFNVAQLRELMTKYGPIREIWFDMGKPTPAQSDLFATTVHKLQPQTMVSGRVWNYEGDFTVMGDNEVPQYGLDEPWQTPASMFNATWGYRSWQVRDDVQGKINENILKLVQVVSRGGNYILNIGPEGDGSVVPYEADVLRGVGAWLKPNAEAIYGTQASPFAPLDFGYATVKQGTVYLFVKSLPKDGKLRLPLAGRTRFISASVMASGKKLSVQHDGRDAVVTVGDTLPQGDLPVIAVKYAGALLLDKVLVAKGDAPYELNQKNAEMFWNYNGEGYEAKKTLYKLRWLVPQGCSTITFHANGEGKVALIANGKAREVMLRDGVAEKVAVGKDESFEITPTQPFVKGTALPLAVTGVDVVPEACSR